MVYNKPPVSHLSHSVVEIRYRTVMGRQVYSTEDTDKFGVGPLTYETMRDVYVL